MAYDEALVDRISTLLAGKAGIERKAMFGGVGFLRGGNMLVGVWKRSLVVRIGPDAYDAALREPHVAEFDVTGRPMKGWVLVGPEGVADDGPLAQWLARAEAFGATLASKPKKRKK